jgi:pSer/pThr/pTyr-binding forkhead associated (FHA) protein
VNMTKTRRPAGDLIEAVVRHMRTNIEELRYTTIAPSRYTVYLSQPEYTRLEGILPRLRAETIRALNDELERHNRRRQLPALVRRWVRGARPLENADAQWHVEFLPDLDGDLQHEEDIIVHSELILPPEPELGEGERTRRITTVQSGRQTVAAPLPHGQERPAAMFARLSYQDSKGAHQFEITRESTTIGRGGTMYPVDVRVAAADDVSREHARIRRDASSGGCFLIDLSTHGTTIEGAPVPKGFEVVEGNKRENGVETRLPERARIGLAGTVYIDFQQL